MKKCVVFTAIVLVVLAFATSARAAELDIRVTFNHGTPLDAYSAQRATISVYEWRQMYSYPASPWHQGLVGEFRCPVVSQDNTDITPQGCIGADGRAYIYMTPNGTPLRDDRYYLVKVDVPGFRSAKAEWIWVGTGYGLVDLDIERNPFEVYTSPIVWGGVVTAYHYVYNNTSESMRLRLDTNMRAAGVTSKENEIRGNTVFVTLGPNTYTVYTERWAVPTAGQTYGEENCIRGQLTSRGQLTRPGEPPAPISIPYVSESIGCLPNGGR